MNTLTLLQVIKPLTGKGHAPRTNAGIGWGNGKAAEWERRRALNHAGLCEVQNFSGCSRVWAYAFTNSLTNDEIRALAPVVRRLRETAARHARNMRPAPVATHDTRTNHLRHICRPENFKGELSNAGNPILRLTGHKGSRLTAMHHTDGKWHLCLNHVREEGVFVASGDSLEAVCDDFRAGRNTATLRRSARNKHTMHRRLLAA